MVEGVAEVKGIKVRFLGIGAQFRNFQHSKFVTPAQPHFEKIDSVLGWLKCTQNVPKLLMSKISICVGSSTERSHFKCMKI